MPADNRVELADLLLVLWTKKWIIIIFSLIVAVVAAGFSLLMPNIYEASAAVISLPPKYKAESPLQPEQISIKTYEDMALADETFFNVLSNWRSMSSIVISLAGGVPETEEETNKAVDRILKLASSWKGLELAVESSINSIQAEETTTENTSTEPPLVITDSTAIETIKTMLNKKEISDILNIPASDFEEFEKLTYDEGLVRLLNLEQAINDSGTTWKRLAELKRPEIIALLTVDQDVLLDYKMKDLRDQFTSILKVETETPTRVTFSPLLKLIAQADRPADAMLLANLWCLELVERAEETTSSTTKDNVASITNRHRIASEKLKQAEKRLTDFNKKNQLDVKKEKLNQKVALLYGKAIRYSDLTTGEPQIQLAAQQELETLKTAIQTQKSRLEAFDIQVSAMENENGNWAGLIIDNETRNFFEQTNEDEIKNMIIAFVERLKEKYPETKPGFSNDPMYVRNVDAGSIRKNILCSVRQLVQAQKRLADFKDSTQYDVKKQILESRISTIKKKTDEIDDARIRAASLEETLQLVDTLMKIIPEKIGLSKLIPMEVFLERSPDKNVSYEEDVINPYFEALSKPIAELRRDYNLYKGKADSGAAEYEKLKAELQAAYSESYRLDDQLEIFEGIEKAAKDNYDSLREQYVNTKLLMQETQQSLGANTKQLSGLTERIEVFNSEITSLESEIQELTREQETLQREVDSQNESYQIAQVQMKQARFEESDATQELRINTRAVEPEEKVAPRRKLIVIVAFMLAFMFACIATVLQDYVIKTEGFSREN